MKRAFATVLPASALLAAAPSHAGRDALIMNITGTPVSWLPGVERSVDKVARAVITACARLGWVCSISARGEIAGRLNLQRQINTELAATT